MPSSHAKKTATKPALTRRSTKGPLEGDDDPLTASLTSSPSSQLSPPSSLSPSTLERSGELATGLEEAEAIIVPPVALEGPADKDLSFLLESAIYHPLGQVDVPPSFRKPFPPPPRPNATLQDVYRSIEELLAECHFLGAAHLAALILTSNIISPTDHRAIFRLLSVRYSSLELSGNTLLASQEAKALEDLTSTFYYTEPPSDAGGSEPHLDAKPLPEHIMPFDFRLQAIRLQSIGFSDARRGISALYDVGMECREHISSPLTPVERLPVWETRLGEVGIHVVNALIETGDLDCAQRTMNMMALTGGVNDRVLVARRMLLALKMGDTEHAQNLLQGAKLDDTEATLLSSLLDISAGRYTEARAKLTTLSDGDENVAMRAIAKQNLAVAQLYTGDLSDCRTLFEELVNTHNSFQTLTTNLATIYELSSDHARQMKLKLVDRVAGMSGSLLQRAYVNADFKL